MTKILVINGQKIGHDNSMAKILVINGQKIGHDNSMAKILVTQWPKNWSSERQINDQNFSNQ